MKKSVIVTLAVLVFLCVAVFGVTRFVTNNPSTTETEKGEKNITISVTVNGVTTTKEHSTSATTIRGALDELQMVSGIEAEYGLFVQTVNGYTIDESAEEWWKFSKNGEMLSTGIENAPFEDGDCIQIELMQGYDSLG